MRRLEQKEIAIEIKNLTKEYKMYPTKKDRLIEAIFPGVERHTTFRAMDNLNLEVKKGEILGILGKNGAGKSTLLKMVTGVVTPTSGEIKTNGKISSLLELGTAFNMELTGIENIYQHGQVMGLTKEEIEACDGIIVAADKNVETARFDGKPVLFVKVADGIHKPEELIKKIQNGEVPIHHETAEHKTVEEGNDSTLHTIYKHLMNGVSHMLPLVVGGGILIALAFLIDGLCVDMTSLTAEARQSFGSITPVAATLKSIGNLAFGFMLPVLAGFIAMSIADRPGLAVGFVGGAIAANGKSGFLGALVAGFLAGYLILLLKKLFGKLPEALEKIAPVLLYPVFGILIVGLVMTFVVEPPIGALNTALNTALTNMSGSSKVLLGIIVAGMMAVDMGGPFNKAAYVFGTASIAAGN